MRKRGHQDSYSQLQLCAIHNNKNNQSASLFPTLGNFFTQDMHTYTNAQSFAKIHVHKINVVSSFRQQPCKQCFISRFKATWKAELTTHIWKTIHQNGMDLQHWHKINYSSKSVNFKSSTINYLGIVFRNQLETYSNVHTTHLWNKYPT